MDQDKKSARSFQMTKERIFEEVIGVVFLALAFLFLLSLASYSPDDLPWYTTHPSVPVKNLVNIFGAYMAGICYFVFGLASYLIPAIFFIFSLKWFRRMEVDIEVSRIIGLIIAFLSFSSFFALIMLNVSSLRFQWGGIVGLVFSDFLINYFGLVGAYIIVVSLGLLSLPLVAEISIIPLFSLIKQMLLAVIPRLKELPFFSWLESSPEKEKQKSSKFKPEIPVRLQPELKGLNKKEEAPKLKEKLPKEVEPVEPKDFPKVKPRIQIAQPQQQEKSNEIAEKIAKRDASVSEENYALPTIDLLESPPPLSVRKIEDDLQASAHILEDTLSDFGITVRVVNVERGPVITRYELEPAPGVKVQRIVTLADDIALAMKASSVRIVAPIPGKSAVGIEVPNGQSSFVYLKEVLSCEAFRKDKTKLTLALGKDIGGDPVIADLAEMPHLLIAGTTGSGKTVCVNGLIMSLLFNFTPSELKFIMIDPKKVELVPYNGLAHLLCPVVTEIKKASSALAWVVNEMDQRYLLLAKEGVRNIDAYNQKKQKLPYIIVIIDELADLMMVARDQIETAIMRLAQLSRAVGIHMILATQRPSVDVITGVIKANFPARISFKVASKVDSRTVLDLNGADKLLGKGDMLFLKPGEEKLIRAQSSFMKDDEINRVVDFIKKQMDPLYDEEILKEQEKTAVPGSEEKDELYETAVKVVLETQNASVSILQRRLRLGYTRAARIIDMMEEQGLVGPYNGNKHREILVDRESYFKKDEEKQAQP